MKAGIYLTSFPGRVPPVNLVELAMADNEPGPGVVVQCTVGMFTYGFLSANLIRPPLLLFMPNM